MQLENKPPELIDGKDLQSLVENQVPEGKTIEYKQLLPGNSDSDKKEFLADVSSFANAVGGYLIYGIKEESGVPLQVSGLHNIDSDAEILRLESMIREGIKPRIPAVSIRSLPLEKSALAMIIRIPKSWASPHMVTFKGHSRFYARTSAGKYPLDVYELRTAFALSEATTERIGNFRIERLGNIVAGETPVPLPDSAKIVLHIIPFGAFNPAARFDLSILVRKREYLWPISASGLNYRHNFDGILTFDQLADSTVARSYLQVFRNGNIEAVDSHLLRLRDKSRTIPSTSYEKELIVALQRFLLIQKLLGVEPPLFVMVSLLGVSGYTIAAPPRYRDFEYTPIDRDSLVIPEILLETFECEADQVMRPIFDATWNAAGWPHSVNYNEKGRWVEP